MKIRQTRKLCAMVLTLTAIGTCMNAEQVVIPEVKRSSLADTVKAITDAGFRIQVTYQENCTGTVDGVNYTMNGEAINGDLVIPSHTVPSGSIEIEDSESLIVEIYVDVVRTAIVTDISELAPNKAQKKVSKDGLNYRTGSAKTIITKIFQQDHCENYSYYCDTNCECPGASKCDRIKLGSQEPQEGTLVYCGSTVFGFHHHLGHKVGSGKAANEQCN